MKPFLTLLLLLACLPVMGAALPVSVRTTNGTSYFQFLNTSTNHGDFVIDQSSAIESFNVNSNQVTISNGFFKVGTFPLQSLNSPINISVSNNAVARLDMKNFSTNTSAAMGLILRADVASILFDAYGSANATAPISGVPGGSVTDLRAITTNYFVIRTTSTGFISIVPQNVETMRFNAGSVQLFGNLVISTNLIVTNSTGITLIYGSGALSNAVAIGTFGLIASNAVGSVTHQGGNTTNTGTGSFTSGIGSYDTTATVNIAATGWTNTFGKNAVVYLDGTAVTFSIKNNAGTSIYTNAVSLTGEATVILQPGGAVIASGTGVAGRATPF